MTSEEPTEHATRPASGQLPIWLAVLILTAATLFAYRSSLRGVFLFDDTQNIVENERIQKPVSLSDVIAGRGRPVLYLSLALNYQLGGLNTFGYHVLNVSIHLMAGLALLWLKRTRRRSPRIGNMCWLTWGWAMCMPDRIDWP